MSPPAAAPRFNYPDPAARQYTAPQAPQPQYAQQPPAQPLYAPPPLAQQQYNPLPPAQLSYAQPVQAPPPLAQPHFAPQLAAQQQYAPQPASQLPYASHQAAAGGQAAQQAASSQKALGAGDVAAIRSCLPNLAHLSDELVRSSDIAVLIQLNKGMAGNSPQQSDFQSSAAQFLAAAAAHLGGNSSREPEPAVLMAKTLESIKKNPTQVPAGSDDRNENLHQARFLGGAVCGSRELFIQAREALGPEGVPALSNYDMGVFGLGGSITMRGWKELHNPGSSHNTLKLYSPYNLQSATGATRRLTLADGDGGINVGEHLKEIADMEELKLAMRILCSASILATPWNHSYLALDAGLHLIQHGAKELAGYPNRALILTRFINHVIELNANAWVQKKPFLTAGEVRMKFPEWLACGTLTLLKPADNNQHKQANNTGGNSKFGRNKPGKGGQFGSQSAGRPQNQQGAGQPAQQGTNTSTAPPPLKYCRRFNDHNNCPNGWANCVIPGTNVRLAHMCNQLKADGSTCGGKHSKQNHH